MIVKKEAKILQLAQGEVFGEDNVILCGADSHPNFYTVKVESTSCTLLSIDKSEFHKKFKRILPPLQAYFTRR